MSEVIFLEMIVLMSYIDRTQTVLRRWHSLSYSRSTLPFYGSRKYTMCKQGPTTGPVNFIL